jgi:hypothetical protein
MRLGRMSRSVTQRFSPALLIVALTGCEMGLGAPYNVVNARDLSGTYTGVLQAVTAGTLADAADPERRVIVDIDLLHEVTMRATSDWTLRIESAVIPPLRALVIGAGPVAINAELVEFENLQLSDHRLDFGALKVKQIVFVKYEGEWIAVMQLIRVGVTPTQTVDSVAVYQYVSYPSRVANRMSEDEAIVWVNTILRLASAAQRP